MLNRLIGWRRGLSSGAIVVFALAEAGWVLLVLWVLSWSDVFFAGFIAAVFQPLILVLIAAIRRVSVGDLVRTVLSLIVIVFFWAGGLAYMAEWAFPRSAWATQWRYSNETDLKNAEVVMGAYPHDCEFWSAPMGSKHCHYDKTVALVRVRDGSGGRVMSYDDGRTWLPAEPDTRPSVVLERGGGLRLLWDTSYPCALS